MNSIVTYSPHFLAMRKWWEYVTNKGRYKMIKYIITR